MQTLIGPLLTSYEKLGKGPNILLLHGWGDDKATFKQISFELAKKYTVIIPDLPGFGSSSTPDDPWGLDEYGEYIGKFVKKIDNEKLHAIIAHSNGGAIALRSLANKNISAKKLILLASSGIRDEYKGRKKATRLAAKIVKFCLKVLPKPWQVMIKKKAYKTIGSDLFVAENLQESFKKIITDDTTKDAQKIKIPTLLIYGSEDSATPPSHGKIYSQQMKSSQFEIIDGADHFLHHTHEKVVMKLIEEFLK